MPGVPSQAALRLRCIKLLCLNSHLADVHERNRLFTTVEFRIGRDPEVITIWLSSLPTSRFIVTNPLATHRVQMPMIRATPSDNSVAVTAQARTGMMNTGIKRNSHAPPVYCSKLAKFPNSAVASNRKRADHKLALAVSFSKSRISSSCLRAVTRLRPKVARSTNRRNRTFSDFTE
jgi:hypothetical protein